MDEASEIIVLVFFRSMPYETTWLISNFIRKCYNLSAIFMYSNIRVILFISEIMKFIICVVCFFTCLFVTKNKVNPMMEIKADRLRFKKLSMPFDKVITIIKFNLRIIESRWKLNIINFLWVLLNSEIKFLCVY